MTPGNAQIWLASASTRRRELLQQAGIRYETVVPELDESGFQAPDVIQLARLLAREKAYAACAMLGGAEKLKMPLLGADTIVTIGGKAMGKPRDREQAIGMLETLSGQTHQVMTAVCIVTRNLELCDCVVTDVTFKTMTKTEISRYCDTVEPYDKAGAYAIQGRAGVFVTRLEGSYSGVVGLPLYETVELLGKVGVNS